MVSSETSTTAADDREFGGGYYVFFGVIAGFFVTIAVALTLMVAAPVFTGGGDETAAPPPTSSETTVPGSATGDPVAGEQVYSATCAACHGPAAEGVPGLGPALANNEFVSSLSDAELVTFLEEGRGADHPDNTTGIAMPPKGGNPSLTEQDLNDVVAFLRTINP